MTSRHADTRGRVYGEASIRLSLSQQSWDGNARRLWLLLQRGDSAWTPNVSQAHAYGPATVCYTQYRDGSIDLYVAN